MKEEWAYLEGYPNYMVSNLGRIYNARRGTILIPSPNQQGILKINLAEQGIKFTRSIALMVAIAFVPNDYDPDIFATPIHLDGDRSNCKADNLAWRPRWFAVKYQRQFNYREYDSLLVRIADELTGTTYSSPKEAAVANGLLIADVVKSYAVGGHTFPTGQKFLKIEK